MTGLAEFEWPEQPPIYECESDEDKVMAEALENENRPLRRISIRCMATSLGVTFFNLCAGHSRYREQLHPFTWGTFMCGPVGCMMAVLVFASHFEQAPSSYYTRQAFAVVSIGITWLLGKLWDSVSMPALAYLSLILWLVSKQWDIAWGPWGMKLVLAYCICEFFG
eukprot:CAMPEP_0197669882 /NCGR_PEP_ID=MMETSP1338-20131121/73205_1 /TAXON_ID=43686 ORGANISM="Pelagodinium beii, Strain RCC1491" /NCGR_SAMPLE_ID=MMETSP1338 /ASSEMBLY_ACC=CAM_ASM_000754 /LENGTH=165 /DNA_ID=CAMNT_0043249549 /DNA_START=283 /DNA_END=777 /DNA_ORIENTATION=-